MSPESYGQFPSPYNGMGNNPISGIDPDGGCVDSQGNSIPCPGGIPEAGNENLMIMDEVYVYGSNGLHSPSLEFNLNYPSGDLGVGNRNSFNLPKMQSISPMTGYSEQVLPKPPELPYFDEAISNAIGLESTIFGGAFSASAKQAGNFSKLVTGLGNGFAAIGAIPSAYNIYAGYRNGHISGAHIADAAITATIIGVGLISAPIAAPIAIIAGVGYGIARISKGDVMDEFWNKDIKGLHFDR